VYYRKAYKLTALLLLLLSAPMCAQDTLDFTTVENATLRLYNEGRWKELENLGNTVIQKGFDYYYTRIRTAIAAFENRHYRAAIQHFKKAIDHNGDETLAYEYLYYCYLYSNRPEEAARFAKTFHPELKTYMRPKITRYENFMLAEGGLKLPDSTRQFKTSAFGQYMYGHSVASRFSLTHAVNYVFLPANNFSAHQFQYYLRANLPLKNNWLLSAGAHVFYSDIAISLEAIETFTTQDPPIRPGLPPPPPRTYTALVEQNTHDQLLGVAAGATAIRHLAYADVSGGLSFLLEDTLTQLQANAGVLVYPFRNNNFTVGGTCYLHSEDYLNTVNFGFSPVITTRIYKNLFLNVCYFANRGDNISENTVAFINNSFNRTNWRLTATPYYTFSPRFTAYATFGYEEKVASGTGYNYHYLIGLAGIRFNPFKNNY